MNKTPWELQLEKKALLTPSTGANLCGIDPFEFAPDNLTLVQHYDSVEHANMAMKEWLEENPGNDAVVLVAPTHTMREVGTASSGNRGHVGRPGFVGGSGVGSQKEHNTAIKDHAIRNFQADVLPERGLQKVSGFSHSTLPMPTAEELAPYMEAAKAWDEKIKSGDRETIQNTLNAYAKDDARVKLPGYDESTNSHEFVLLPRVSQSTAALAVRQLPEDEQRSLENVDRVSDELGWTVKNVELNSPRSRAIIDRELSASSKMPESVYTFKGDNDPINGKTTTDYLAYLRGGGDYATLAMRIDPKVWIETEHSPQWKSRNSMFDSDPGNTPWNTFNYALPGHRQEWVVTHEMGHLLESNLSNKLVEQWQNIPNRGLSSDYSRTNEKEHFAESYTLYRHNRTDRLGSEEISFFRDTLKVDQLPKDLRESEVFEKVRQSEKSPDMSTVFYTCSMLATRKPLQEETMREGSATSGNHGHVGRPGFVGGSGVAGKDREISARYTQLMNVPHFRAIVKDSLPFATSIDHFDGILYHNMDSKEHADAIATKGDPFYLSKDGVYGPGLYLATDKEDAEGYGSEGFALHVKADFAKFTDAEYKKFVEDVEDFGGESQDTVADILQANNLDGIEIIDPYGSGGGERGAYITDLNVGKTIDKVTRMTESDAKAKPLYVLYNVSKAKREMREVGGPGSGNYGHAGRHGKVGGSQKASAPYVPAIIKGFQKGGFTVSLEGKVPKKGFMIAGEIAEEQHDIPADGTGRNALLNEIRSFASNHAALLTKSERYIGGWFEKDKVYLDVSQRLKVGRSEALRIARDNDQIAVWDLRAAARGEDGSLYTMSDHERPSESKGTILESESQPTFVPFAFRVDENFEANLEKLGDAYDKLLGVDYKGKL